MEENTFLNNRYRLLAPLGSGGMAVVFKAYDNMLERNVAIKVLKEDYASDPDFRERFKQEAKAAANLSHPNIVTVYDFGFDDDKVFIVIEYIDGTDLKTLIRRKEKFNIQDTVGLMAQACAGVGYAHRAGLVHCDIKPHNMLVSHDFRLKVTDFGIARALASIHPDERSEIVWGSPHYFSPEQAAGMPPSPASDVYSLGVILYEMLTGKLPFESSDATELSKMHRVTIPTSPRNLNPAIPEYLEEITLKVLSKEPSGRYRTADQLGRVLMSFKDINEDKTGPIVLPKPSKTDLSSTRKPNLPQTMNKNESSSESLVSSIRHEIRDKKNTNVDWVTWLLGLLAFTAIFGLIPFWLYIYFAVNP
jgi:serine/threonine-protein kinase